MSVFLRVTYTVRAQNLKTYKKALLEEVIPQALELGIQYVGAWKTVVGRVGEYMELWQFESMADFENRWPRLLEHPRIQQVFETTGPMVDDETFELIEPVGTPASKGKETFRV